jgi:hypothetical protein
MFARRNVEIEEKSLPRAKLFVSRKIPSTYLNTNYAAFSAILHSDGLLVPTPSRAQIFFVVVQHAVFELVDGLRHSLALALNVGVGVTKRRKEGAVKYLAGSARPLTAAHPSAA